MKKIILTICILSLGVGCYWGYSKYEIKSLKSDVADYLKNKGLTSDDYLGPKYVQDKSLKGYKADNIEIIFNGEKNYTYYYIKEKDEIKVFYAKNNDTGEADFNKKEPF